MAQLDLLDIWLNSPMGTKLQSFATNNDVPPSNAAPFIAEHYDLLTSEYEASRTPPSINDGVISISHQTTSNYSWTFFYFAIPLTSVNKITFDVKISNYSYSGCAGYIGAYYSDSSGNITKICNNIIAVTGTQHTGIAQYVVDGNTWVSLELDLSDTNLTYVMFGGWWGDYQFRNVKIFSSITYNWQSVPSISGKNGILSLSVIKDELLGDLTGGTWQSVSEVMDALTPNSRLYKYWNNLATGQEVTMCYSGDNYLNIKRDTASSCELKFYFRSGVLIYSTGVNMSTLGRDPYLAMVIDEENHVVQVIIVYELDVQGSKQITWYGLNPSDTEMSALYSWLVYGEPDTPNNPYAQGTTANGGDDFNLTPQDDFSDELPPDITGLDCGFFTVYVPTSGQLQSLASFLWSDDIIDNIKKYFGNVSDSIISLYMLPYKPSGLSTKKFQVGDIVLDDGPSVEFLSGQRYVDVDMGSFSIDPTFNSYLDYEPFTKLSIYLPFIGVQQLPTDEFMTKADPSGALSDKSGSTITVKYRIDLLTGGCVAYIKQGTQNKLQFSGKCGATLPISGANYNNMISGLVQAVGGLASTIASGGLTAPLSFGAAISGTVSAMKPDLYKAGNLSGELSLLSYNRPMIIKTRPNIHKDMSEQIDVDGLPSYKVKTIGDYNGYISCVAVHVDGINCTDAEKEKIHSLLLEGVIV